MWESRNKDRHGYDASSRATAQRHQAQREITLLCKWKSFLDDEHVYLFSTPLQDLLSRGTHTLQQWLSLWKDLIVGQSDLSIQSQSHIELHSRERSSAYRDIDIYLVDNMLQQSSLFLVY